MWRHRITSAGQVSIPAEVRERWGARMVSIVDEGDRLVVRPTPDDPVAALRGIFAARPGSVPSDVAVRELRDADNRAAEAKWKRHQGRA
jgi:AbrB family looped-hinge helix DNA binding protein